VSRLLCLEKSVLTRRFVIRTRGDTTKRQNDNNANNSNSHNNQQQSLIMFCPACEEEASLPQQDGICLTCGEELVISPPTPTPNNTTNQQPQTNNSMAARRDNDDAAATSAMALLASSIENANAINPSSLLPLVNQLRGAPVGVAGGTTMNNNIDDLAGILPPEALNPQAGAANSRPVSQVALDNLKRIVLTPQSAELFDAQISLFETRAITDLSPNKECLAILNAVPGEFGPMTSNHNHEQISPKPRSAAIVICSPRTTKGGKLSTQTLSEISFLRMHRMPFVAYVERGDGITFVQKALVCQSAGKSETSGAKSESFCIGVIVGNTASGRGKEIWPYVMQDTKHEAQQFSLEIPVIMVRQEDGRRLVQLATTKGRNSNKMQYTPCQMKIASKEADSHTCPVCTDSYAPGDTIVRLPLCGHIFHESCALAWLTKHNSCPYCRKELPTDDDDYERERRRREANSADVSPGDVNGHSHFYG